MPAKESFESGLVEVERLANLDVEKLEATPADQVEIRNALNRAAVVLTVSHFESFLKSLSEEFMDAIGTGSLESRQVPLGIREAHTLPRLSEILKSNDPAQRRALLKRLPTIASVWSDSAKPPKGALESGLLKELITSAQAEKIDALFAVMGAANPVCDGDIDLPDEEGNPVTLNIRYALEDMVKCRNDIAHGDPTRRPTNSDVARYRRFVEALSQRLQRKASALTELAIP